MRSCNFSKRKKDGKKVRKYEKWPAELKQSPADTVARISL